MSYSGDHTLTPGRRTAVRPIAALLSGDLRCHRAARMARDGLGKIAAGTPREATVSYTGDVSVGGPADSREIDGLSVTKLAVGPMDNNAYLLRCLRTGEGLLIDA